MEAHSMQCYYVSYIKPSNFQDLLIHQDNQNYQTLA